MARRGIPIVSCRVQKLRTGSDVAGATRHGRREGSATAHADPARRHLNQFWGCAEGDPSDLGKQIAACREQQGAVARKGASLGFEMLVWGTAEACEQPRFLHEMMARSRACAEAEWGKGCVAAQRMDWDEQGTPTVSNFIVPVVEKVTKTGKRSKVVSVRSAIGGEEWSDLAAVGVRLQDSVAAAFEDLGIQRGIPSARKNLNPAENRRAHAEELAKREANVESLRASAAKDLEAAKRIEAEAKKKRAELAEVEAKLTAQKRDVRERVDKIKNWVSAKEAELEKREAATAASKQELEDIQYGVRLVTHGVLTPLPARGQFEFGNIDASEKVIVERVREPLWDQVTAAWQLAVRHATGLVVSALEAVRLVRQDPQSPLLKPRDHSL